MNIDWDYEYQGDPPEDEPTWWERLVAYLKRTTAEVMEAPENFWP